MGIDEAVIYISREEGKEEGIELGRLETTNAFTEALLKDGRFDKEEIARLVGVPVAFVQEVKARL